jgi:hypothetical protein
MEMHSKFILPPNILLQVLCGLPVQIDRFSSSAQNRRQQLQAQKAIASNIG